MQIQEFITKLGDVFEETDLSTITPETRFKELEEWSSMSALSLIAFADEVFEKEIEINEIRNLATIDDLFKFLQL